MGNFGNMKYGNKCEFEFENVVSRPTVKDNHRALCDPAYTWINQLLEVEAESVIVFTRR